MFNEMLSVMRSGPDLIAIISHSMNTIDFSEGIRHEFTEMTPFLHTCSATFLTVSSVILGCYFYYRKGLAVIG